MSEKTTREEFNKRKHKSYVEEFKRVIRHCHKIKVNSSDNILVFNKLIESLRELYNTPNKDFSKVGTNFMISKYKYKIMSYKPGEEFSIESFQNGELYEITYFIKKSLIGSNYKIIYHDLYKGSNSIIGFRANVSKYFYKKEVKKNAKKIKRYINEKIQ